MRRSCYNFEEELDGEYKSRLGVETNCAQLWVGRVRIFEFIHHKDIGCVRLFSVLLIGPCLIIYSL